MKVSKIIVTFILCICVSCFCVFSQENENQTTDTKINKIDETTYTFNTNPETESVSSTTGSTIWMFVRMVLVLILVIALIYGIVYFLKKSSNPRFHPDPYLKDVASLTIAQGKSIHVVTLNKQAFIIGVSDNSINLISEVNDSELIDAMNLNAETEPTSKPKDFLSILKSFTTNQAKPKSSLKEDLFTSALTTEEILKQQRERLTRKHTEDNE